MKPIAWYDPSNGVVSTDQDCPLFTPLGQVWPLYPKSDWVELTDEDMADITSLPIGTCSMMLKVEAKLKEKNGV